MHHPSVDGPLGGFQVGLPSVKLDIPPSLCVDVLPLLTEYAAVALTGHRAAVSLALEEAARSFPKEDAAFHIPTTDV